MCIRDIMSTKQIRFKSLKNKYSTIRNEKKLSKLYSTCEIRMISFRIKQFNKLKFKQNSLYL